MNNIINIGNTISAPSVEGAKIAKQDDFGFAERLKKVLGDVNDLQLEAGELSAKFATGEVKDIHEVMVAAEKANISFELVMEVRNKLVEAYREIMRMQI